MVAFDWEGLLRQWNAELLQDPEIFEGFPADVVDSGWLGYPPASDADISAAEARLSAILPPSYKDFLKVTNGWRDTGRFTRRLLSVEEIEWLRTRHADLIDAWMLGVRSQGGPLAVPDETYFVYGDAQRTVDFRDEYLQTTLQVSEMIDTNFYLLNPQVVTPEGEWEAWFFAPWLPGAERHRSFWELMQAEHEYFLEQQQSP